MAFSVEDQIIARPLSRKQRQAAVGVRKARKKRKNVILCSRDMRIMRSLFEGKVMSREQINKQFFPDVSKYTVNIRLNKIMSLGLIKRKPIAIERGVFYGYSLTQKGLAEIKPTLPRYLLEAQKNLRRCSERESERYKKPYERSEYTLHDIALNDIRKAFERRSTVQRYYTENVMQSCNEYHDDNKFQPFIELNSDAMAEVDTRIGILNLATSLRSWRLFARFLAPLNSTQRTRTNTAIAKRSTTTMSNMGLMVCFTSVRTSTFCMLCSR